MSEFKEFSEKHKKIESINQLSAIIHYISVLDMIFNNPKNYSSIKINDLLDRYEKASLLLAKLIVEAVEEEEMVIENDRKFGFSHAAEFAGDESGSESIPEDG